MKITEKRDLRNADEKRRAAAADTRPRVTLSFYRYVKVADPVEFRSRLLTKWSELDCMGRIYVAHEGINAQMNVPKMYWDQFDAWVQKQPELEGIPYPTHVAIRADFAIRGLCHQPCGVCAIIA